MTEFVTISEVRHGDADGSLRVLPAGTDVTGEDPELLRHLYVSGSLAVKGSPDDPNEWIVHPESYTTTPAVVEEALRQQAADKLFGVEPREGTNTQPHREPAEDPTANLTTDVMGNGSQGSSAPAGGADAGDGSTAGESE